MYNLYIEEKKKKELSDLKNHQKQLSKYKEKFKSKQKSLILYIINYF